MLAAGVVGGLDGRLGVLANWRCETKILFDISPSAFVPPPKVTSSVVRLVPRAKPLPCRAGALEALPREGTWGQLNAELHAN